MFLLLDFVLACSQQQEIQGTPPNNQLPQPQPTKMPFHTVISKTQNHRVIGWRSNSVNQISSPHPTTIQKIKQVTKFQENKKAALQETATKTHEMQTRSKSLISKKISKDSREIQNKTTRKRNKALPWTDSQVEALKSIVALNTNNGNINWPAVWQAMQEHRSSSMKALILKDKALSKLPTN